MKKIIEDKDLGKIVISESARAKRYSIKIRDGVVVATLPIGGDLKIIMTLILENKEKIKRMLQKSNSGFFLNEETKMTTATFTVDIKRTDRSDFYLSLKDGKLNLACPMNTVFEKDEVQKVLKNMLERALRHEAKRLLPKRLLGHAKAHGFTFSDVKINNSKGRWGSCSGRRSINLSLSLMLLPWHLIDYVLLHELCHTKEMNHSDKFWALMDSVTDNKATQLREELKKYRTWK